MLVGLLFIIDLFYFLVDGRLLLLLLFGYYGSLSYRFMNGFMIWLARGVLVLIPFQEHLVLLLAGLRSGLEEVLRSRGRPDG